MKKTLSLLLVVVMVVSLFAGCGSNSNEDETTTAASSSSTDETTAASESTDDSSSTDEFDYAAYYETSSEVYDENLGEYYEALTAAKEAETISERYALMAIAEAKLLESGTFLPIQSGGGNYALGRTVPYTCSTVMWGNDYERYHDIIVTTELLKATDRTTIKEKYAEMKSAGNSADEYMEWVVEYLAEAGYETKDSYTFAYSSDPTTWDVLATSKSVDSEAIINTYDGLLEYDQMNELQPALAESYEVSDDGLTYTFYIRQGVYWVDSQGREYAEVTADDFVAGFQHMLDSDGGLEYLVEGIVAGASEYIAGTISDFGEVGVEATDTYTLVYTLESECSYFLTMLGYGVFAPMNRAYFESQGGAFGRADYQSAVSSGSYTYGTSPEYILYCGPYIVTNNTAAATIVFSANESYWNADGINVKTITWLYNDGTDTLKAYNDVIAGTVDAAGLNSSAVEQATTDGYFDDYSYVTSTTSTTYCGWVNINRYSYVNTNDGSTAASPKTDTQKSEAYTALQNQNFRLAFLMSIDRASYMAQSVGETLKYTAIRNSYTPGVFVSLEEDVTVDINGTATTFTAGTYYGEIMQAQLDADGVPITAWDPDADDGVGSSDGYDGWYNPEAAMEYLEAAIAELAEEGIEISEDNPIYLDYPYYSGSETNTNRANVIKQSVEESLGGLVIINLVECASSDDWYYSGYYTDYGYEQNNDFSTVSGWGPDYGDPSTYLDTMLPDGAGYMTQCLGMW